jgi:hypothetical protein
VRIFNQSFSVHATPDAQPIAIRAGSIRSIKGEIAGLEISDGVSMNWASQIKGVLKELGRQLFWLITVSKQIDAYFIVSKLAGLLYRLRETSSGRFLNHNTVNDNLNGVLELLSQHDRLPIELTHLTVNTYP